MALISLSAIAAEIYRSFAEIFSYSLGGKIPDWFSLPAEDWPLLFNIARLARLRPSQKLDKAIEQAVEIEGGSLEDRQREYKELFIGDGYPPIWLYESYYLDGRVPGPTTFALKNLYSHAGLEVASAELPDHAAIELAFLAHLAEHEELDKKNAAAWRTSRKLFLKNHLLRWFPDVVRSITVSGYPSWEAVGYLADAVFNSDQEIRSLRKPDAKIPVMTNEDGCSLCGFCIQRCPQRALSIQENSLTTALWLIPVSCNGCQKCVRVCPGGVLSLRYEPNWENNILLRESPRSKCIGCGTPTMSEAELAYVSARIGNLDWLEYCVDCRKNFPYVA